MVSDVDQIAEGKAAWQRIKARDKSTFSDWIEVGRMLIAGRSMCMKRANCNKPYGPNYHRFIREWLEANGLQEIDSHERRGSIIMVENLVEIETWRSTLSDVEIRRCNHPNSVLAHWRRKTLPMRSGPKTYVHTTKATHVRNHGARPVKPSQDLVRIVAAALHKNWTVDTYPLASAVLASMREHREEFLEFLTAELPPPKPSPRLAAPIAEHATA